MISHQEAHGEVPANGREVDILWVWFSDAGTILPPMWGPMSALLWVSDEKPYIQTILGAMKGNHCHMSRGSDYTGLEMDQK